MQLFDTTSFWTKHRIEMAEAAEKIFRHGEFIQGPEVRELEQEVCDFTGSDYCITCGSGTDALYLALRSLDIGPGDTVITTPFSFIATAEAIARAGAHIQFADVSPCDFNISADAIVKIMNNDRSKKIKAIIVVNIFGMPADYKTIRGIAKHYKLKIIEDAAQSFGASYGEKMSCTLGDIGCTSFFPTKLLGGIGDGGAVFTNNQDEAELIRSIANHGSSETKYNTVRSGINSRLDTLNAAALRIKLKEYRSDLKKRMEIHCNLLSNIGRISQIAENPEVGGSGAIYTLPILCKDRTKVMKRLRDTVPYAMYYLRPLTMQPVFKNLAHVWGDFPVTESICEKIINLPCHEYLRDEDIELIIKRVNE